MLSSGSKSSSKTPILFDIRIRNTDNTDNVLIVKGDPENASSVLLSGVVVLSVLQPIQIKNLRLYLTGKLLLNLPSTVNNPNSTLQRFVKFEKLFFTHNWDNFNIESYFDNLYDNYNIKNSINSKSSTNIVGMQKKRLRSKSNSSILSLGGYSSSSSNNSYRTLMQGNYEFPFSAILPGSMTESIEGLKNAAVVYKLQATVERPKLPDLVCTKHLRVIRTLSSDAVELSESTAIDNSWPKKVEYSISIPAKAIAIGSSTPIDMSFVPILKGLKLGPVKIYLIETVQCSGGHRGSFNEDRVITRLKIKDPIGHVKLRKLKKQQHLINNDEESLEDETFQDRWNFETVLNIPSDLSKCSQDAVILSNIKLRHKLKFVVSLINPDGHISELRASLPIQLFISPFVAVSCKSSEAIERCIKNFGKPIPINPKHEDTGIGSTRESIASLSSNSSGSDNEQGNLLFAKNYSEVELQAGTLQNNVVAPFLVSNLMTPPNYGNHVYDRLYAVDENGSGTVTPRSNSPVPSVSNPLPRVGSLPNNVLHMAQFEHPSPQLNGSRSNSNRSSTRDSPINDSFALESPIAVPTLSGVNLAGIGLQISRAPTPVDFVAGQTSSHNDSTYPASPSVNSDWKLNSLSRVPSYTKAVNSDIIGDDLPPSYPTGSEPKLQRLSLERPQSARQRSSSFLGVSSNRLRSSSVLSRSNNSSNTSLHAMIANDSHLRLSGIDNSTPKNTANKVFSFNMTPVQSDQVAFAADDRNGAEDSNSPYMQQVESFKINRSRNGSFNKKNSSFSNFLDLFSRNESGTY
ncbi:similar to Saccharomyces cerevisiae YFR022W ROG3 Protein that binds the ubiquitin ligase Rsp5p via its 2 PY motifs [Maudiozyma saulgeensis]|uniref:Similar to Saccharomyces cerevisiae YFR022W ROG3 Protein that binds the ubiquitin ligase Rsp5p via its 2 PY motifs n=1 Tax=Maudiozyma saulgeensis TaxID=1789683 RepID=A0A1X7QZU7_9SACH|nr:similar to Saccharomyces cerevisiae YFR022W ROG3 Protein that binds the ubiquitin ligase Rsp5p via its 2 PY motifs [Kazachstania saulgeensis]